MSPDRFHFGEIIGEQPDGTEIRHRLALVVHRRESRDKRSTYMVVACPNCGDLHDHGDVPGTLGPFGYRGAHCLTTKHQPDYYILECDAPAVPPQTAYPRVKPIRRPYRRRASPVTK